VRTRQRLGTLSSFWQIDPTTLTIAAGGKQRDQRGLPQSRSSPLDYARAEELVGKVDKVNTHVRAEAFGAERKRRVRPRERDPADVSVSKSAESRDTR